MASKDNISFQKSKKQSKSVIQGTQKIHYSDSGESEVKRVKDKRRE